MKRKILLMNMPSSLAVYKKAKIKMAAGRRPFISLASLAAKAIQAGGDVKIIDLMVAENPQKELIEALRDFEPEYVGVSFTTPLFNEAKIAIKTIKEISPNSTIIIGGVHTTLMPEETLKETEADIAVIGEGEITLSEIIQNKELERIKGIFYKKFGKIIKNEPRELIGDLDSLPLPAWQLLKLKKYKNSKLIAKKNPVVAIETSRGCVGKCIYCNKSIFGRKFRWKSAKRVVKEFEYVHSLGFREVHIVDDMFTTNLERAKDICRKLIKSNLKINWRLEGGVRVDFVDQEFFNLAKRAGCYCVNFGYESGNQKILDNIQKGITLEQSRNATTLAKMAGLEVIGFFILGLPGETTKTMDDTIEFAKGLNLDFAKFTLVVPFPGTKLFQDWKEKGFIKSEDWTKYNYHTISHLYAHPNLDWATLKRYYNLSYRRFYFRPSFIAKRLITRLFNGGIFWDAYYAARTWLV